MFIMDILISLYLVKGAVKMDLEVTQPNEVAR